ncbi:hypothetical protein FOPG_19697 [Fusarium oxysporum f. sp. conglutinans race 2 54008]|nr:hypothetical protein FOPG_19697 [Fusarium oxysporum f. sp. conglutinans race 2 54008]KAG6988732.1 hypothetical protein FocnCong_v001870 [Fusarium oxysporum f. sp. conglutinans]KAI8397456.1 hypothetical protein FOFC_20728 [Fusarium oxysporum]
MFQQESMPMWDDESKSRSAFTNRLVVRSYNDFLLLAACLVISSLGLTIFGLSQADGLDGIVSIAAALLASAAITAIVAVAVTIVLQFTFRSVEAQYERLDLIMSWEPLFLLNVVLLEAMADLLLWYTNNSPNEVIMFLAPVLLVSLIAMIMLSLWVRRKTKTLIGMIRLNNDEVEGLSWEDRSDATACDDEWPTFHSASLSQE